MKSEVRTTIAAFFAKYPKRSYPKGEIIIFAGEDPESVYYIIRGKIRVYDVSSKGEEVIVNVFSAGAYIPMSWALTKTPNQFFYKTEEDTTVRMADPEATVEFLQSHPDVMFDLLRRIYVGAEGMAGKMVHLMFDNAQNRLVYELITECRRFGHAKGLSSYRLDVNESGLAARTGLSRETVSREMHRLKDEGLVSIGRSGIVINNLKKLENKLSS